jgi:hypothetical protein
MDRIKEPKRITTRLVKVKYLTNLKGFIPVASFGSMPFSLE